MCMYYATGKTARYLESNDVPVVKLYAEHNP